MTSPKKEGIHLPFGWDTMLTLIGGIALAVWGYATFVGKIADLEEKMEEANIQIEELVEKHIEDEGQRYQQMEEELSAEGELPADEMENREEFADEELGGESPMMEDLEIDDDIIDALEEELQIDIKPTPSGWLETPTEEIVNAEVEADAHAAALDEDEDDKKELEEAVLKAHELLKKLRNEKKRLTEKNEKYKQSILQMKDTINEVNVENARLLYTNRALSSSSLNERQKNQIVESISNASTVEEAKVIYETLQSTVGQSRPRRERKPQSLSEAIHRRSSTLLSQNREEKQQSNPYSERMKKLAGIN